MTDVLYNPQGDVQAPHTVNVAEKNPDDTTRIIIQFIVPPGATQLLVDAYHDDCEIAVVVSNDSDLLMPIQVVTREFKKPVGLLNPQKNPSRALLPHVAFIKQIRPGVLAKSQFPKMLRDSRGSFSKPASW